MKIKGLEVMSLKIFSNRFGIQQDNLSWGIVKITRGEKEPRTTYLCAVLVKEVPIFINIVKDVMEQGVNKIGERFEFIPCTLNETEEDWLFEANNLRLELNKKNMAEFYAYRIFSADTRVYLGGSFWK
ncbi:MAG: hypothetical protein LBC19_00430 [Tannerella sp.]|jgi:hypothetical protein|nr:hypothetical protein [Tannerella sp.]